MPGELLGFVRCRDRWQRWRQESCSDQQLPSPAGWWRQLDDGILLDECCIFFGDDSDYPGVGKCPVLGSLNFTKTNICWRGKRRIKVGWCEKWGYLYTHIYQHLLPCHVDSTGTPRCWRSSWHLPPGTEAMAVFNTVARFNHSCVPNVHNSWNMETKTETLYAVAPLFGRLSWVIAVEDSHQEKRDLR